MKYDLHTHSIYSDGELSIEDNVKWAKDLGLDGIAATDHDNIDSWEIIPNNTYELDVIRGVELSTQYKGVNVHVLGFYKGSGDYSELNNKLHELREKRENRVYLIIDKLKALGINISYDDVKKYADGSIGRLHIAKAIIEKYPEKNYSVNDIFDLYLCDNGPAYVPTGKLDTEEAVSLLKRNNCLVILAHPLKIKNISYKEIMKYDFDGIECYYPYKNKNYKTIHKFAKDNNLIVTCGSDFHGPIVRNTMGDAYLEGEELDLFLKLIR